MAKDNVEIEALKDFGGKTKTLNKVKQVVQDLKLDPENEDRDGYVLMMLKRIRKNIS